MPYRIVDIIGYEGFYAIDTNSNIISFCREKKSGYGALRLCKGVVMRPSLSGKGYLAVRLTGADGIPKSRYVHRLMGEHFIHNDSPQLKTQINHKNGVKLDNRIENLEWCDVSYNHIHAFSTGLKGRLSVEDVRYIKESNMKSIELSLKFNVDPSTIHLVRNNKTWRFVK